MITQETCLEKYREYKRAIGAIPKYREFLKFAGLNDHQFERIFGRSPYLKLQLAAGDTPNKLKLEATPLAMIMEQYGALVIDLGDIPPSAEWDHRGLRPTSGGILRGPLKLKWSELPQKFVEWVTSNGISHFSDAIAIIQSSDRTIRTPPINTDLLLARLIKDIRDWMPARRRNTEETYKVELRKHLESLSYRLNEEHGESNVDLVVDQSTAIELKRDPSLAEYDRLFGQTARHLQTYSNVIVLIFGASRGDRYDQFAKLVDRYLNVNDNVVELILK